MTKDLLIKFIKGATSGEEEAEVLAWIDKSKENEAYYIGLKNLWVSQNLSAQPASPAEVAQIRRLTGYKSGAAQDKTGRKLAFYKWGCYAACLLLLVSLGYHIRSLGFFTRTTGELPEMASLASVPEIQKNYYYTVKGVKARIELPDGSVVWLNSDSRLIYPCRFEGETREVEISGEALFEVKSNPDMPMIVHTNRDFKIKVYGTTFNVRTYANDVKAVATLYKGRIDLIVHDTKGAEQVTAILPNQVYEIEDAEPQFPVLKKSADIAGQSAWQQGKLVFDNTPLGDVIKNLERWHGTIFEIKDPDILNDTITATFRSESVVQIMEMLEYCALIDYTVDGNKVVLSRRK